MKTKFVMIMFITFAVIGCDSVMVNASQQNLTREQAEAVIDQTEDKSTIAKDVWLAAGFSKLEYDVLWDAGTERAGTGALLHEKRAGTFVTAACNIPVFSSDDKYDSGTGWPSFTQPINEENIVLKTDYSFGMRRTEILSKCGEHLGHVFNDGPADRGGLRYCINSAALRFIPAG